VHLGGSGRVVHNFLAGLKVSALVVFIALGLTAGMGSMGHLGSTHEVAAPATGWLLALVPVMFAYSGWNAAAYVAEEIRDPSRNVPLALGIGTLAVVVVYLALNVLYFYAMPISELANLGGASLTDMVAERLFGFVAGNIIAAFTIVSIAASVSAMVLAGPRIYYAMARDGVFLPAARRVHPKYGTPVLAIVAQGIWSSVLVLCGTLSELVTYTGFAVVLFAAVAVLSLFVLRRREPDAVRPFTALGYPLAPALFVVASFAMVMNELWNNPSTSLVGVGVILAGVPIYLFYARRRAS
jgi:APA family basic amino acid/polyamine antiporter